MLNPFASEFLPPGGKPTKSASSSAPVPITANGSSKRNYRVNISLPETDAASNSTTPLPEELASERSDLHFEDMFDKAVSRQHSVGGRTFLAVTVAPA